MNLTLPLKSGHTLIPQAQFIQATGKGVSDTAREKWCGQMALSLRASGNTIKHVAKANFSMLMETFTRVSGPIIKQTEREYTLMLRAHAMRACGLTTNNMVRVLKPGQREPPTMESTR